MAREARPLADTLPDLADLKNLSVEDKTETGLLRSRVEDQSHLIMILKQRADEHLVRAQTQEKINKELEEFRDSANSQLKREHDRYKLLEDQFFTLSANHDQIIRFKDEYKEQNDWLRKENTKLRDHLDTLVKAKLEEKDREIETLRSELSTLQEQLNSTKTILEEQIERELKVSGDFQTQISVLRTSESSLKQQLLKVRSDLSAQSEKQKAESVALTKEKDEMLQLAMQRGKLCEEKQREVRIAGEKLAAAERRAQEAEERYARESEQLNANSSVRQLRQDLQNTRRTLQELRAEYSAYKEHAASLLDRERQINMRLRNNIN